MTCKPVKSPEVLNTVASGFIHVGIIRERLSGYDIEGNPRSGRTIKVMAYASNIDLEAAYQPYAREPEKYVVECYKPALRVGVTYAGGG